MTKKKSKRLLCLFLSLSLVFAFNVTPAFAADTDTSGEVTVESTTETDTEDETSSAVGVTINSSVASIGDTGYTSLADAFSAAEDGDTITLLQGVSVEESTKSDNGLYQVSGIGVTLDLNENTLTITNKRAFGVLTEGSSLTIENGTIDYNASGDTTLAITRAGASFSAEDVTFEAIDVYDGTTTTSQYLVYAAAGGDVTLTNCTISNVSNAVVKDNANSATVVLNCCTFSDVTAVSGSNTEDDAYTIYFNNDSVLVQDSSKLVKVEDGYTYVVREGGSVTADSTIYVKEGGKLVLDGGSLNGSVVIRGGTLEVQSGTVNNDITVESGGILTVSGGTVSGAIANSGTTSISGGTISGAVTNASDAALTLSDEGVINNTIKTAGTFTMTGGTVSATGLNSDNGAIHVTDGTINISGGTVTALGDKARAISTASNASIETSTISGGTFTGSNLALLVQTGTTGLTVTGGTFITSASGMASIIDRADAIGSGYAAYDTTYTAITKDRSNYYKSSVGDYTVIVAAGDTTAAATVTAGDTTTYYISLADAVSAANVAENAATITLLQSVDIDKPLSITSTVTLDLAGYTISESESFTSNYSSYYIIWVSGSLTVKDSDNNDGCISTSAKYGVAVSGGTLTLDSGKITNTNSDTSGTRAIHLQSSAIVSINGGEVVGSGTNAIYVSSSTLTITGGSVSGSSSAYGIYQYGGTTTITDGTVSGYRAIYGTSGTVNVNGGTVTGTQMGIMANGSMDVNIIDGTVTGTNAIYMYQGNYTGTVTISGGNIGDSSTSYAVNARCGTAYITGGTITATSGVAVNAAYSDTKVYIGTEESESGPTLTGSYAVQLYSEATVYIYSGTITGSTCGVYMNKGTLYVTGGSISGTAYGIASNGTNNTDYYPNYITISGGTISGAWGMYLPAVGSTTTITGGTIIGTSTGIEIRAGSLTVSGGTIKSTSDEFAYTSNGSGTTVIGAGIAISQHSTNQEVTVTITGGTITSNYYGIFEVNTYSTSTSDVTLIVSEGEDGSLPSISGDTAAVYSVSLSGNVDGLTEGVTTYSSEVTTVSISAGTFSDQIPLDYCAENYQPTTAQTADDDSTYYTVETKTAVAIIAHDDTDDIYYDTLSAAVEAASSDTEGTITIIGAATVTDSMAVSKNVSIDVADGSITIGTEDSTTSDVTLTIYEGATVTITASGDGYVANYGTITVNGTLDISALGYTTDTDEAGGLLSGTCGKLSIGANGVFVAPTVWNEMWSWNPNMTSATSSSGIFSSAAFGAVVQCGESEWKCTTAFESTNYDSNVTYWSEAMETGVVKKNIDLNSGVIALNFYIYVADGDEVTSVQVDEKTYTDLDSYYDSKTGYYVFSQTVAPTKMTVDCKVIITLSDESTVEYSATVRDYVTEAFNSATDKEKAIMAAMLNYGAMCQVYYGTNSTDLANANLSDAYKKSRYSISDYASVLSDASSSKEGSGATLSKLSMTQGSTNTLTLTYSSLVVTDLSDCTISVTYGDDEWTEYSISGMKLTITDIEADMLGTNFTVTVKYDTYTSTASVSGYYYIYSLLTSDSYNSQTNLVNMLCSMVAYCESYKVEQ